MKTESIFRDFEEFWFYTRSFSNVQRETLFQSLSDAEQKRLKHSFQNDGWEDLFMRNKIDRILDQVREQFGIDILQIKAKVANGRSHYMKKSEWDFITDILREHKDHHKFYALGGMRAEVVNPSTVLLIKGA